MMFNINLFPCDVLDNKWDGNDSQLRTGFHIRFATCRVSWMSKLVIFSQWTDYRQRQFRKQRKRDNRERAIFCSPVLLAWICETYLIINTSEKIYLKVNCIWKRRCSKVNRRKRAKKPFFFCTVLISFLKCTLALNISSKWPCLYNHVVHPAEEIPSILIPLRKFT